MIKIIYENEAYDYGLNGKQPYNIKSEIEIIKDAAIEDVVAAMVKIMRIATYHITRETMINAVNDYFDINE